MYSIIWFIELHRQVYFFVWNNDNYVHILKISQLLVFLYEGSPTMGKKGGSCIQTVIADGRPGLLNNEIETGTHPAISRNITDKICLMPGCSAH